MPRYTYSTFTKTFFDAIDTPNKAYVLGFMYGDGNVGKKTNEIRIILQVEDKPLLEKIKKAMSLKNPVRARERRRKRFKKEYVEKYCILTFCNKQIKQDLIKHGCVPNKSLILKPPKNIPEDLVRHFIRGLMDADGCFFTYTPKDGYRRHTFLITGTKEVISYCAKYIPTKCYIHKNKKIWEARVRSKKGIITAGNYLYKDSPSIYLQRKYDKFQEIKDYINNN